MSDEATAVDNTAHQSAVILDPTPELVEAAPAQAAEVQPSPSHVEPISETPADQKQGSADHDDGVNGAEEGPTLIEEEEGDGMTEEISLDDEPAQAAAEEEVPPVTPAKTIEPIELEPEQVDVPASPPAPPPKTSTNDARVSSDTLHRPDAVRADTQSSMQEVDLNGGSTPVSDAAPPSASAASAREGELSEVASSPPPATPTINLASASTTSLHSTASTSVQSPSRPGSTRPGSVGPGAHAHGRPSQHHSRRSSTATTLSLSSMPGQSAAPQLSSVLITPPLQVLVDSKEAKKSASFRAAAQRALDLCQDTSNAAYLHPREIFEPLRLAISNPQTTSVPTLVTSLDLLAKLVSHSFFNEPHGPPKGLSPLSDLITHSITLAYSESSPPQVALQVVKALMAVVLSTDRGMLVHQSSLLKAVRTVYNVFLLSNDAANQVVAQGALTQMVHHVFGRVVRPVARSDRRTSSLGENEARRVGLESGRATPALGSRAETPAPKTASTEEEQMTL